MKKLKQHTFFALGTANTIEVSENGAERAVLMARSRVLELHDRFSAFKDGSDVSRIAQSAGRGFVKVHPDTFQLIRESLQFSKITEGAFDISVRPLVSLWGIGKKGDFIPSEWKLSRTRKLVAYQDILLDETACAVMLKKHGQEIDLGGIAKGYAADEVKRILIENGVTEAIINLGGSIITVGSPRVLGIQNPVKQTGIPMGKLILTDMAAVTSGSNEQFFIRDGKRYHHIIDPRSGYPAKSGLLSVSVFGKSAMLLDAYSTAMFVLGMERSFGLLEQSGLNAVFVTKCLDVLTTAGLQNRFSMVT